MLETPYPKTITDECTGQIFPLTCYWCGMGSRKGEGDMPRTHENDSVVAPGTMVDAARLGEEEGIRVKMSKWIELTQEEILKLKHLTGLNGTVTVNNDEALHRRFVAIVDAGKERRYPTTE